MTKHRISEDLPQEVGLTRKIDTFKAYTEKPDDTGQKLLITRIPLFTFERWPNVLIPRSEKNGMKTFMLL